MRMGALYGLPKSPYKNTKIKVCRTFFKERPVR